MGGNDIHVKFESFKEPSPHASRSSTFFQHSWNLHAVWDTGIIEQAMERSYNGSRTLFEQSLSAASRSAAFARDMEYWLECSDGMNRSCTEQWGEESFQAALEWAYRNFDDDEVVNGSELGEAYYETRLLVVEHRIIAAGVRLAATLEKVLFPFHQMIPPNFFSLPSAPTESYV